MPLLFMGNFVGQAINFGSNIDPYDTVNTFVLVLVGIGRNKVTFYWNKRDQEIIWDYTAIAAASDNRAVNPPIMAYGLENNVPNQQANDT